ncbi:MAG: hypothetical protein QOE80_2863 [Actinomycetota bacterium]|nr:hypothetical protein [Actinomycetota bacterium]
MSVENFRSFPATGTGLEPPTIAIVGGGASGLITAAQLLRHRAPVRIVLVEERPRLGRGVAYDTTCDAHLLNVPAAGMSAYPDDPGHFIHWARTRRPEAHAGSFLPRRLYGEYLEWCLDHEIEEPRRRTTFTAVRGRVAAVVPGPDGVRLELADGGTLRADTVVLALGNSAGPKPLAAEPGSAVRDAWQAGALEHLPPGRPVALVGTGLTAVDVIVALDDAGFDGPIHAVSRRGLLPRPHQPVPPAVALLIASTAGEPTAATSGLTDERNEAWPRTARALVAALRAEVDRAAARGRDWRTVVDGLRPHTQALWASLPEPERARLHRHALRYWEVHRHRMAPEIAERLDALRRAGRLEITTGRVVSITARPGGGAGLTIRPRRRGAAGPVRASSPDVVIEAGAVIRCTGPTERLASVGDPLLDGLFRQGDARPGPLGLGLDVDGDGRLRDRGGRPSDSLWALGPLRRGALLETTSIPEIREQAAALARVLPGAALAAQTGSILEEAL